MQPIHLAIGFVEGLITAAVLLFVYEARPEMLDSAQEAKQEGRLSFLHTMAILGIAAALIGGGLSLAASANPDGLEWSIEQITGSTELNAGNGNAYAVAGSIAVLAVCVGVCFGFRFFRRKKQ